MTPALQICKYLVSRGFDVTVPSNEVWAPSITAVGAHASPLVVCIPNKAKQYGKLLDQLANDGRRGFGKVFISRKREAACLTCQYPKVALLNPCAVAGQR